MSNIWFVIAGVLLIGIALTGSVLSRLPVTTAMFYMGAGAILGPWGLACSGSTRWTMRRCWSG